MRFLYSIHCIIKNLFEKKIDNEPACNDKYIKTKINSYNTKFWGHKTPTEGEHYARFSLMLLDSIVNVDKKYNLLIFLKKRKYAIKKKKIINAINQELDLDEFDDDDDKYDNNMLILLNAKIIF